MTAPGRPAGAGAVADVRPVLLRRGVRLEQATLAWNVAGIAVLVVAATRSRSVALVGFGLDSLVEIGASAVVLRELGGRRPERQERALRLIAYAFLALAGYLALQAAVVLALAVRPRDSPLGVAWTALTAAVMLALAVGKSRTGRALGNPVLVAEGRVTVVDALLAAAVLLGLLLDRLVGVWQADPLAALVIVLYAGREARAILTGPH